MTEKSISGHLNNPSPASESNEQYNIKLQRLKDTGYQPYMCTFHGRTQLSQIRAQFEEDKKVKAAGRVMSIRLMGKSIFADLNDGSDRFQVYANKSHLQEKAFEIFKLLDSGDIIGVQGELFATRTGEKTIRISDWLLLAKALRPLPEKWHGLRDIDTRYRQRYLDLISNPSVRNLFNQRFKLIREIRLFLWQRGFCEVETPMMQSQPGGAVARPFQTHYTSLMADMVLRIAPELYLKRLLVGGFDKIFELNRNFRNEGLSRTHNPEFTMVEIYQSFSNMSEMKILAEELITSIAMQVFGTLRVGTETNKIDLSRPWAEKTYSELIIEKMGPDWFDLPVSTASEHAKALGLVIDPTWNHVLITHEIYEKIIQRGINQPTFVTRLPASLVTLAKVCEDDPTSADVFELVIGGMEIGPGYSEMNDPVEQRKRFEAQASAQDQKIDEDFILALEYGMPPAGGMGIGIDRLVMLLTGVDSIREVILFPQLRTKKE